MKMRKMRGKTKIEAFAFGVLCGFGLKCAFRAARRLGRKGKDSVKPCRLTFYVECNKAQKQNWSFMKVKIKNIGLLDETEFEVGCLTMICGENNTGKTYATYSLYGYLEYIANNNDKYIVLDRVAKDLLRRYLDGAFSNNISIKDTSVQISTNTIKDISEHLFQGVNQEYKKSLAEIMAGKDDDFNDSEFQIDAVEKINSYIATIDDAEKRKKVVDFFSRSKEFELLEINKDCLLFDFKKIKAQLNEKEVASNRQILLLILLNYVVSNLYPRAFILSAERTGATMFQKELDLNRNEILEQISKTNAKDIKELTSILLSKKYSRYPKPVRDNVNFIRELDEIAKKSSFIKKEESALNKEIIKLLQEIVGGKYVVSQEGIEFAPGAKQRVMGKKFLVQRASSSVRSLLMLNYYVLHIAQRGDILMIDEPELNLHPKNQILVARLLVLLVNAGVRVFITTHSDYIVRELSNCIMLHNLSEEQTTKFEKQGYKKEHKLDAAKVKAYLAEKLKGSNILREVKITQEQGIFIESFDEPIESQNNNQGDIFAEVMRDKDGYQ